MIEQGIWDGERERTNGWLENGELKSTEFTMITETSVLSSLSKVEGDRAAKQEQTSSISELYLN